jgi:hypothetical protein
LARASPIAPVPKTTWTPLMVPSQIGPATNFATAC